MPDAINVMDMRRGRAITSTPVRAGAVMWGAIAGSFLAGCFAVPGAEAVDDTAIAAVSDDATVAAYRAAPGQANDVSVTVTWTDAGLSIAHYRIDDVVPIETGRLCSHPDAADPTVVVCDTYESPDGGPDLVVELGDEDDLAVTEALATVRGGAGDDVLGARGHGSTLVGGPGADMLLGSPERDYLRGDEGADRIAGGRGGDQIAGGPGDDVIYGNSSNDIIFGNSGDDSISGGPGRDTISGGPGRDSVRQ
ncbi:calcium-binding protein [Spongisporangium articulatum]|uniref:Calcium-binding protein n=1 Tax=Spongisporangium articulatum TaxID=3362603 RepID=A0ABW8AHJ7_9ACTN